PWLTHAAAELMPWWPASGNWQRITVRDSRPIPAGHYSAVRGEKRERSISGTKVLCYHRMHSTHQLWSYGVRLSEMQEEREASVQLLKTFAPLDGLKRDNLAALAKKVSVRTMPAGRTLFKEGDTDKRTMWLVGGMIEIRERDRTIAMLRGGTPETRNPLYPKTPRTVTARATEEISYLSIDSELLDVMITWDQTGSYEAAR